jgi:hypothetical protein
MIAALVLVVGAARADEGSRWSMDPGGIPWETLATVADEGRTIATTHEDVESRLRQTQEKLASPDLTHDERVRLLVEMGDLFRDDARVVIAEDFEANPRYAFRTSPAWLQLELSLGWYEKARQEDAAIADVNGRNTLLMAALGARLEGSDTFDDVTSVVRTFRGTPYIDLARAAVGDHLLRVDDPERARAAYRGLRGSNELSDYARLRIAEAGAALGEDTKVAETLVDLARNQDEALMTRMVAATARTALASQVAPSMTVSELIEWGRSLCGDLVRCEREVAFAAADGYAAAGDDAAAAWLREIDPLVSRLAPGRRVELAVVAAGDWASEEVLRTMRSLCPADDPACRADAVHRVASWYEDAGIAEGAWIAELRRLPGFPDRPDMDDTLIDIVRNQPPAPDALSLLVTRCGVDPGCGERARAGLLAYYDGTWRAHDARWLRWVAEAPPFQGADPDACGRIVRERLPPDAAIALLVDDPSTTVSAARLRLLAAYYRDIGEPAYAGAVEAWSIVGGAGPIRDLLAGVITDRLDAIGAINRVADLCQLDDDCIASSVSAARSYYRASGQAGAAEALPRDLDAAAQAALVRGVAQDARGEPMTAAVVGACRVGDVVCAEANRRALAGWFERRGLVLEAKGARESYAVAGWAEVAVAVQAALRQPGGASGPLDAIQGACADDARCAADAREALAVWYEARDRHEDARAVRTATR